MNTLCIITNQAIKTVIAISFQARYTYADNVDTYAHLAVFKLLVYGLYSLMRPIKIPYIRGTSTKAIVDKQRHLRS